MQQPVLVSIVSAYYNRQDWVDNTIESLINQTYSNIEIIIFDDASTDDTYEKLHAYAEKDKRIKLIRFAQNKGFVLGMIEAIAMCQGEYIAIQGSGDISFPERIAKQADILAANPKIGLVGSLRNVVNKSSLDKLYAFKNNSWVEGEAFSGDASKLILKKNLFSHGEVMFRKSVYDKCGGYREIFTFAQDRDLWIRMSKICQFHTIPEVLYERYFIEGAVSINPEKRLIQRLLSELAVQCGETETGNKDIVQKYGLQAPFFLKPSRRLSIDLSKMAIKWLNQNEIAAAKVFAVAACNQKPNLMCYLVLFMVTKLPLNISLLINKLMFKIHKLTI
ncbi:glycosyltransferase [Paraglaciecola sp. L3A3]|uniref:glycosyltransferase family 2 protein n=1 Tax=Paraglaciecola sp. L3A3 TaxID=2686358 RepID=UPI00131BFE60|nr:glycosyltransferase [Paraglaciecola sp. L3A3]